MLVVWMVIALIGIFCLGFVIGAVFAGATYTRQENRK